MLWVENDRIEKVKRCLGECMDWWKYGYGENQKIVELLLPNEVIVYRVVMYANPLLIIQAIYFTSKSQSVYYSTQGGGIYENI